MDPLTLINILMHAVSAVPSVQSDISNALKANWSKGIVQDFAQGVSVLHSIVNDVGASFEPSSSGIEAALTPSPVTVAETPAALPVQHTNAEIEAAKAVIAAATAQGQVPPAS